MENLSINNNPNKNNNNTSALNTIWNAAHFLQRRKSKLQRQLYHQLHFTNETQLHNQLENVENRMNLRTLARLLIVKASKLLTSLRKETNINTKHIDLSVSESRETNITLLENPYFLEDEWLFTINNVAKKQEMDSPMSTNINNNHQYSIFTNETPNYPNLNMEENISHHHLQQHDHIHPLESINNDNNNNNNSNNNIDQDSSMNQMMNRFSPHHHQQTSSVDMTNFSDILAFIGDPFDNRPNHHHHSGTESNIITSNLVEHSNISSDNEDFRFNDRASMQSDEFNFPFDTSNLDLNNISTSNSTLQIPLLRQRQAMNLYQQNTNLQRINEQRNMIEQNMISPYLPPPPPISPPTDLHIQDRLHQPYSITNNNNNNDQHQQQQIQDHGEVIDDGDDPLQDSGNDMGHFHSRIIDMNEHSQPYDGAQRQQLHISPNSSTLTDNYSRFIEVSVSPNENNHDHPPIQRRSRTWMNQEESLVLPVLFYINYLNTLNIQNPIFDFQSDIPLSNSKTTSELKTLLENQRNQFKQTTIHIDHPFVAQHFYHHRNNDQIVANQLNVEQNRQLPQQQLNNDAIVPEHTNEEIERGLMDMNDIHYHEEDPVMLDIDLDHPLPRHPSSSSSFSSKKQSRSGSQLGLSSMINIPLEDDRLSLPISPQRQPSLSSTTIIHSNVLENALDYDQLLHMRVDMVQDMVPDNTIPDSFTLQLDDFLSYLQLFTNDQQPTFIFQDIQFSITGENKRSHLALAFNFILVLAQKNKLKLNQFHPYGPIQVSFL
ncbi:unnamed protein product [Cunninghamella blakesleeana]